MAKLLHAPPAPGAIAAYVSDLSARLSQSAVGQDRAAEIMQEAEAHLRDHADALLALGIDPTQAEVAAVRDFLPAERFARDTARSTFEDSRSRRWYRAGAVLGGLLLTLNLLMTLDGGADYTLEAQVYIALAVAPFLAVCAFASRRIHARCFGLWGVLAAVFTFLYVGHWYVDNTQFGRFTATTRSMTASFYRLDQEQIAHHVTVKKWLTDGVAVYQSPTPHVPAILRRGTAYVVPIDYSIYFDKLMGPSNNFSGARTSTVATLDEAQAHWLGDGAHWLETQQRWEAFLRRESEQSRLALAHSGFAWRSAITYCGQPLLIAGWLILIDTIFCVAGRWDFLRRRARSRRLGRVQHG